MLDASSVRETLFVNMPVNDVLCPVLACHRPGEPRPAENGVPYIASWDAWATTHGLPPTVRCNSEGDLHGPRSVNDNVQGEMTMEQRPLLKASFSPCGSRCCPLLSLRPCTHALSCQLQISIFPLFYFFLCYHPLTLICCHMNTEWRSSSPP
jgi:hypothetical protein